MSLLAVAHLQAGKNKTDVARTFHVSRRMLYE
jgi:hypothetical protein